MHLVSVPGSLFVKPTRSRAPSIVSYTLASRHSLWLFFNCSSLSCPPPNTSPQSEPTSSPQNQSHPGCRPTSRSPCQTLPKRRVCQRCHALHRSIARDFESAAWVAFSSIIIAVAVAEGNGRLSWLRNWSRSGMAKKRPRLHDERLSRSLVCPP